MSVSIASVSQSAHSLCCVANAAHFTRAAAILAISALGQLSAPALAVEFEQHIASLTEDGEQGKMGSVHPSMDTWGDYIAFSSEDPEYARVGDYLSHVFVRDRHHEATVLVSRGKDGPGNAGSYSPDISADSEYVAFASLASNLICATCDKNDAMDVFLFDRLTGLQRRISEGLKAEPNESSFDPSVSSHGNRVAFTSWASNLVGGDSNDVSDVFVWDRYKSLRRVSVSPARGEFAGPSHSPQISDDGKYVVFVNDVGPGRSIVYVHEVDTYTTYQVSEASDLTANGRNIEPSISHDGAYIAWSSNGYRRTRSDESAVPFRAFVRQMVVTTTCAPWCVNTNPSSWPLNDRPGEQREPQVFGTASSGEAWQPAVWLEGVYGVAFTSTDEDGHRDVLVQYDSHNDDEDHIEVLSSSFSGETANDDSYASAVRIDVTEPRWWRVVFVTQANNLGVHLELQTDPEEGKGTPSVIYVERTQ